MLFENQHICRTVILCDIAVQLSYQMIAEKLRVQQCNELLLHRKSSTAVRKLEPVSVVPCNVLQIVNVLFNNEISATNATLGSINSNT